MLIFVGRGGIFKTTSFYYTLPPILRKYFINESTANYTDKDVMEAFASKALMCCAVPHEDMAIDVAGFSGATAEAMETFHASVAQMERLSPDVMRVMLQLPAGQRLLFAAGQYINILLDDGQRRAFSFANRPGASDQIELHVRLVPGGRWTTHVFDGMKPGDNVRFEGPLGQFTLRESQHPILFIAGATGFAPIKSIVEDAFARGVQRPMRLYWGVRQVSDLSPSELLERRFERLMSYGKFKEIAVN